MRRRWPARLAISTLLVLGACGRPLERSDPVPDETSTLDLYLIGDAGRPDPDGEPVLIGLARAIRARGADNALVVFLGDNIYPEGVPDDQGPLRESAERILRAQLDVPVGTGARGIFVSGNHGWDHSGPAGWREIVLQEEFVRTHGQGRVEFLPGGGCPGPAVRDVGDRLRLLVVDTQWWLHPYEKPDSPQSPCPAETDEEVVALIRKALAEAGDREVVVVAHHPLISGGTHGVFPLLPTRFSPMPMFDAQDLGHPTYRHMREVLQRAFAANPPLLFAAGHDHNLQLLHGVGTRYAVVSGAGFFGRTTRVRALPATIYRNRAEGFMRLSVLEDGRLRLSAYQVDASGTAREDFAAILQTLE